MTNQANKSQPIAANDNARFRGTLPALNWLAKKDHEGARAIARILRDQQQPYLGPTEPEETVREIRPTIGEMMKAASDAFRVFVRDGVRHVGSGYRREGGKYDPEWQYLGALKFYRGALVEWGQTKAGKKLTPRDEVRGTGKQKRNPSGYLKLPAAIASPLVAEGLRTPMSEERAIPPMYDPLPRVEPSDGDRSGRYGVEEARAELAALMAKGHPPITKCPPATAKGAYFFGGISRPKPGTSLGTIVAWQAPEPQTGRVGEVVDEIAARGTLTSIGLRFGYSGGYADRGGKEVLLDVAKTLVAANDNAEKKAAA